jgi:surface antigen
MGVREVTSGKMRQSPVRAAAIVGLMVLAAAALAATPSPGSPSIPASRLCGAHRPGSGQWYWPVGSETFGGYAGWLASRGASYHVAQDMRSSVGHPVYAIGDGVVWIARADAGGYGTGGTPGGCLIIVHTTATGQSFRALYGHVSGLLFKAGSRVRAGAVIAKVNGCGHLHFSIHPSASYRDGNPYAGHVPKSWADHGGFVDPVKYLRTHARSTSYSAPALPRVKVLTATAPLCFGAVAGAAYWTEEGAAGTIRFCLDLRSGMRRALGPDEVAPPFDRERYAVRLLGGGALGFTVDDRLPTLTADWSTTTPPDGEAARVTGQLANAAGRPFRGALVQLEEFDDAWARVGGALTGMQGRVSFELTATAPVKARLRFLPPAARQSAARYLEATSAIFTITPGRQTNRAPRSSGP